MTDHDRDRGAYTPSGDGPLAFDARNASGRGTGRPPTTLIVSALILLVLVGALIFYYRSGVRRAGEPPVVGQPVGDVRQAPPASAQPASDAAAGLQVYSAEQAAPAASAPPTFAPSPETPLPRPTAPAAPVVQTAPPAHAATSAPAAQTPAAVAAPPKPAAPPAPASNGGGAMVQIGAFSSPSLADKGWNDVARLIPGSMAGRTKRVEPVSKDPDTLYRAYVGGFDSKADAVSFCADLKAAGHACIVK